MQELAQNLIDAISLGSLYALIAIGVALVFSVMGLLNFAHGELIMISAYVLLGTAGWAAPISVGAVLLAGVLLALGMERTAFRPVRSADPSTQLITSFAVAILLDNVIGVSVGTEPQGVATPEWLNQTFAVAGLRIPHLEVVTVAVAGAMLVFLVLFLNRTRLGIEIRAAAEDFQMARALGVDANKVIATAFAISGFLAAIVALVLVAQTGSVNPQMGLQPILVGFVALVVGGMSRLGGAILGGFVIGALAIGLQAYLPDSLVAYRDAFLYGLVILVLLFRPHGLLGPRATVARI